MTNTAVPASPARVRPSFRLALAALCLVASARASGAQGWEGGFKTGVSQAGTDSREFAWSLNSTSALFARRAVSGPLFLQPEVTHLRRAGSSSVSGSTLHLVADYVELPVMLQMELGSAAGITPYLSGGPSVGIRLRCRLRFVGGGVSTDDSCEEAGNQRSNQFDVGLSAGAGLQLNAGISRVVIEARVSAGLRPYVLPIDVQNGRNFGWSALAGLSMPLHRVPRSPRPVGVMANAPAPAVSANAAATYTTDVLSPARAAEPGTAPDQRISVRADSADVRDVLARIGQAVGLGVVVGRSVQARVSIDLVNVTAEEAVHAVAQLAGLTVLHPSVPGQPLVVLSAVLRPGETEAQAAARHGVSDEMARWILESRAAAARRP